MHIRWKWTLTQIERQDFDKACTLAGNAILPWGGKRGSVRKSNNAEPIPVFNILLDKHQWRTLRFPDGISFNQVLPQTRSRAVIYCFFTVYFCLNVHQAICTQKNLLIHHDSSLHMFRNMTLYQLIANPCKQAEINWANSTIFYEDKETKSNPVDE